MNLRLLVFLLLAFLFAACGTESAKQPTSNPLQITTSGGLIEGKSDTGIDRWLGIPFAAAPIGELRWKAPQPVNTWDTVRSTKDFGHSAIQHNIYGDMMYRSPGFDEDCLYVNVWAPSGSRQNLPVLLYYYGGGLVAGDGSETRYDGASMATEGIIVVTANYRLNVFGFLAHPELSAESSYGGSGNYGHLDQVAALNWVKDNIAAFGGNPNQITIGGESAGSMSTSTLLASPLSRDLIAGAIGESGAFFLPLGEPKPLAEAEEQGVAFAKTVGAETLSELRAIPADTLYARYLRSGERFSPTMDNHFNTKSLYQTYQNGEVPSVPLLNGWNTSELPYQLLLGGDKKDVATLRSAIEERDPALTKPLLDRYPLNSEEEVVAAAQEIMTDYWMGYPTYKWGQLHQAKTSGSVYRYLFDQPKPGEEGGALHATEIPYALGNLKVHDVLDYGEADLATSNTMKAFFANFIKTGNPNGEGLPEWKPLNSSTETQPVMKIAAQSVGIEVDEERYRVYDRVYYP